MNEHQLRCLCVIAEEKNIRRAARILSRNPSSLTRLLKTCEEELGVPLFVRARDGLTVTSEGESFFSLAGPVLEQFEELRAWTAVKREEVSRESPEQERTSKGTLEESMGKESLEPEEAGEAILEPEGAAKAVPEPEDSGTSGGETPKPEDSGASGEGQDREIRPSLHSWTENEIRYLLTIREYQNISRAAQELFVAQPSLSQMILEVETELGQPVFLRGKDGARETEFGRELLARLEGIQQGLQGIYAEMEEFQHMRRGRITFGIPMNLGTYLIPLLLPSFAEAYPGIQVNIRENNTSELEKLLMDKKIDFCIMHDPGRQESLEYTEFSDDPFYLVVPGRWKGKLDFSPDSVLTAENLEKLADIPFVMVANRQKLRLVADQILSHAGIKPRIRCTTRSMETAKRLVAAGMGVTFLPGSYMTLYSGTEGLEAYPVDPALGGSWKLVIARRKRETLPRSSREFLRMMQESLG